MNYSVLFGVPNSPTANADCSEFGEPCLELIDLSTHLFFRFTFFHNFVIFNGSKILIIVTLICVWISSLVILFKAHFQQTNPGMEHFQSKIQSQTQTIGPIGSKSQRYISSQSIQLGNGKKAHGLGQSGSPKPTQNSGKYVSPGKKMAQIQKQAAGEKPKQGPYNKVLIVGLSQEFRSLNGVLSKFI